MASAVSQALGQPMSTPTPTPTSNPILGLPGSLSGATADALSGLGATSGAQQTPAQTPAGLASLLASLGAQATPTSTPASPAGLETILSALGLSGVSQTPASPGLDGMLASLGTARSTLEQGLSGLSNLESLLNPAAQAPAQDQSLSPSQAPTGPPSGAPAPAPEADSPDQATQGSVSPAVSADVELQGAGSDVNSTVADLVGQINAAVTSLNSTTASSVQSLTAAIQRYNDAAAALESTTALVNRTERLMDGLSAETDYALHTLQAMLSTTGTTIGEIFRGMNAALGNATSAAALDVQRGAQAVEAFLMGTVSQANQALQGVRGSINNVPAAAGNAIGSTATAAANTTAAAALSGLDSAGGNLRSATSSAVNGIGRAALGLNATLGQLGEDLVGLVQRMFLPGLIPGLGSAFDRTAQVAGVLGDLQGLLGSSVLGTLPAGLQSALSASSTPPGLDLVSLDSSLIQMLSAGASETIQAPPPPEPAARPGTLASRAQQITDDVQGLNALLGSSVLGFPAVAATQGTAALQGASQTASQAGIDGNAAYNNLLALLSAAAPGPAQAPTQDIRPIAAAPAAGLNLTGGYDALLNDLASLSAEAPGPALAPSQAPGALLDTQAPQHAPDAHTPAPGLDPRQARRTLQVEIPTAF